MRSMHIPCVQTVNNRVVDKVQYVYIGVRKKDSEVKGVEREKHCYFHVYEAAEMKGLRT